MTRSMSVPRRTAERKMLQPMLWLLLLLLPSLLRAAPSPGAYSSLKQTVMEVAGHDEIYYSGRNLQTESVSTMLSISFSIWAAQVYSEKELLQVVEAEGVKNGVADAVLEVLCSVTDLRLVNRGGIFFDPEILDMYDTCLQFTSGRLRRRTEEQAFSNHTSSSIPAIMSAWYETAVVLRMSGDLLWSTWTLTFPVLRVGQLYIEEAIMNNENILITDIGDAAVEALREVAQLALDVHMMEGELDDILHRTVDEPILYASPVFQETTMFALAALDYEERYQFNSSFINPMRVSGVLMLLSTITIYAMLRFAARLRRIRIDHVTSKLRQDTPSIVHFRDHSGVEKLLEQSSGILSTTAGQNMPILERLRAEQVSKYRCDLKDIESLYSL